MDRPSLRDVIRRKLHDGALPIDPPRDKIYAGHGSGAACVACGDPIQPAQVEYELNYPRSIAPSGCTWVVRISGTRCARCAASIRCAKHPLLTA
jgi:hypothetical protein